MNASAVVLNRFVFPSSPAPPARAAHRAARRARAPPRRSRVRVTARDARASPERIARVAIANQIADREKAINPIARSMDDSTPSSFVAIDRIRSCAMKARTDARSRAPSASRSRRASVTRERRVGSSPSRSLFREKAPRAARSTRPTRVDRSRGRSIARAIGARTRRADGDDGDDAGVGGSAQGCATDGERDRARARGAERARCARDATRRDHPTTRAIRARRDHPTTRRDATRRDAMTRAGD